MKIKFKLLFFWISVLSITSLYGQSVSAGADIIAPISLTENSSLHFGSLSPGEFGGTCVLASDGIRSKSGSVVLSSIGTAAQNATYTVGGKANATYSISLPASFTVSYLANSMTVDNLKAAPSSSGGTESLTGTLNLSGTDNFAVGATININADQMVGTYSGSFTVTVAYN